MFIWMNKWHNLELEPNNKQVKINGFQWYKQELNIQVKVSLSRKYRI